jgi:hypothetical protein
MARKIAQLPRTPNPPVIRTDFSDQQAWEEICKLLHLPVEQGGILFQANIDLLERSDLQGLTSEELLAAVPADYEHAVCFVVDATTIGHKEFPILVLNPVSRAGSFRAVPSQIQPLENNLSIANMDFEEFASAVDKDGIFRGFPQ